MALLFLVTNCVSTKNKPTNVAFPKTDLDLDEESKLNPIPV